MIYNIEVYSLSYVKLLICYEDEDDDMTSCALVKDNKWHLFYYIHESIVYFTRSLFLCFSTYIDTFHNTSTSLRYFLTYLFSETYWWNIILLKYYWLPNKWMTLNILIFTLIERLVLTNIILFSFLNQVTTWPY